MTSWLKELQPRWRRTAWWISTATLALLYAGLGLVQTGGIFPFRTIYLGMTPVWLPAGLALGVLLLCGPELWPGVALGSFILSDTLAHVPLRALSLALANSVAWGLTALVLRRKLRPDLGRLRDVSLLVLVGILGGSAAGASLGVASFLLNRVAPGMSLSLQWWIWFQSDVMGCLLLTPLLLSWWAERHPRFNFARIVEGLVLLNLVGWVSRIYFAGTPQPWLHLSPLPYPLVPFVIWAALRFGQRGVTSSTAVAAAVAVLHVASPGSLQPEAYLGFSAFQLELGMAAISGMLLAAALARERQAEAARRASDQLYRNIVETAEEGVCLLDAEACITFVNQKFCAQLGYAASEIQGLPITTLLAPDERAGFTSRWEGRRQGLRSRSEIRFRRKDGAEFFGLVSGSPSFDVEGKFLGAVGLISDVTVQRLAQEALRDSEVQYRRLFQDNALPMYIYDAESLTILEVNEAAVRHYGYTREEFLGMTIKDIRPPEDVPDLLRRYAQFNTALRNWGVWRHRKKNGEVIFVEVTTHQIIFAGRRAHHAHMHDVTEQRQAERALQRERDFGTTVMDTMGNLLIVADRQGRVVRFNRAWEHLTGVPLDQARGKTIWELFLPDTVGAAAQHLFAEPGPERLKREGELEILVRHGERRTIAWACTWASDADGVEYIIAAGTDITERRQLEDQLRQAQKMEAIGRLAGGVAHDFNNLLTVISGYSQLALRELGPEHPLYPKLSQVDRAATRAAALTGKLLAFSRRQVLQPRVLDLNAAIVNLDGLLRQMVGGKVQVDTDLAAGLLPIKVDATNLEQIVINLAVNARDAMPEGGRLLISTRCVPPPAGMAGAERGDYVQLRISDSGQGMDAATRARIFEPFFTTKPIGKGTGLGLAMVYGSVKQSQGHLEVESAPGQGTCFAIYFPRSDDPLPAPEPSPETPALPSRIFSILVVEDEEDVRQMTCEILQQQGYRVHAAASGQEALVIWRKHHAAMDLLLTDLSMPEMGGEELAGELQQEHPNLKVLFMSGYTDMDSVAARPAILLEKPFSPATLVAQVSTMLEARQRATGAN
ncbi:MAG: PAS domain S-box protein [Terriglobales bacterium]